MIIDLFFIINITEITQRKKGKEQTIYLAPAVDTGVFPTSGSFFLTFDTF